MTSSWISHHHLSSRFYICGVLRKTLDNADFLRRCGPYPLGRFPIGRLVESADSSGFKILNMFDRESRPTMRESAVESADSAVQSADYWSRPTGNWPSGYGPLLSGSKNIQIWYNFGAKLVKFHE